MVNFDTPPKINIEPENDDLEDNFPFQGCILRFHVNLEGCNPFLSLQIAFGTKDLGEQSGDLRQSEAAKQMQNVSEVPSAQRLCVEKRLAIPNEH